MGGMARERELAIKELERHGWRVVRTTKKGYALLRCSCGKNHQGGFHKTPSNPNHFREKTRFLLARCAARP